MKKVDLSQLTIGVLQEKLTEDRNALDKMRFTHAISPVENPMKIPHTKKNIARMLTELRQRELNELRGTEETKTKKTKATKGAKKTKVPSVKAAKSEVEVEAKVKPKTKTKTKTKAKKAKTAK